MTSEPMMPEQDPSNPAALPPLFSTPPSRPGRVRGGFSMRPAPVAVQSREPVL